MVKCVYVKFPKGSALDVIVRNQKLDIIEYGQVPNDGTTGDENAYDGNENISNFNAHIMYTICTTSSSAW